MSVKKFEEHVNNYEMFDISKLSNKEKIQVLEKLINKFERMCNTKDLYFEGVVDGLNHAWKLFNGISDEYLDGIDIK